LKESGAISIFRFFLIMRNFGEFVEQTFYFNNNNR
jgi:hypothetical protein